MALEAIKLSGRHVELVPLAHEHHDGLVEAVQDGNLFQLWYTGVPAPEAMSAHIDRCLGLQATGTMLPFAVFDRASERVVGMTTYMNIDLAGACRNRKHVVRQTRSEDSVEH